MGRVKTKHNRVKNINLILEKLLISSPAGGASLQELADLCKVSDRNVYRYLRDIEKMGFELIRPRQAIMHDGKGRYQLGAASIQTCQADINLMMLIGLYNQKLIEYRQLLCAAYELFIRKVANQYGIFIPLKWKINS
jgi:AcrR family transcriptional regulator